MQCPNGSFYTVLAGSQFTSAQRSKSNWWVCCGYFLKLWDATDQFAACSLHPIVRYFMLLCFVSQHLQLQYMNCQRMESANLAHFVCKFFSSVFVPSLVYWQAISLAKELLSWPDPYLVTETLKLRNQVFWAVPSLPFRLCHLQLSGSDSFVAHLRVLQHGGCFVDVRAATQTTSWRLSGYWLPRQSPTHSDGHYVCIYMLQVNARTSGQPNGGEISIALQLHWQCHHAHQSAYRSVCYGWHALHAAFDILHVHRMELWCRCCTTRSRDSRWIEEFPTVLCELYAGWD